MDVFICTTISSNRFTTLNKDRRKGLLQFDEIMMMLNAKILIISRRSCCKGFLATLNPGMPGTKGPWNGPTIPK